MTFTKMLIYFVALTSSLILAQISRDGNSFVDESFTKGDFNSVLAGRSEYSPFRSANYSESLEIINSVNNAIPQHKVNVENINVTKINNKPIETNSGWKQFAGKINELGVDFNFNYTGEVFRNINGGSVNETVYLDNFDLTADFNLAKSLNWQGANLFAYVLGNHGQIPNKYIGSVQGVSNIAAPNTWKLYQFWLQQNLFNDRISLLIGLYDVNSEFDNRESSSLFINPSQGIGVDFSQSGLNGPSIFPTTSLTLRMKFQPTENLYIQAAVLDGVPGELNNPTGTHLILNKSDGLLIVGELGSISANDNDKIFLGGWAYTKQFNLIPNEEIENHSPKKGTSYGLYVSAERKIISESYDIEQGLSGFVRVGMANENVNPIGYYVGLGFVYKGLIPGRDNDEFGFALANAITGNPHLRELSSFQDVAGYELNFELTYRMEILNWFEIQPDFQFVLNPGAQKNSNNAAEFGIRFSLSI